MMEYLSPWMLPTLITLLVIFWLTVSAARAPMSSNGVAGLMYRLQKAVLMLAAVWVLYGLFVAGRLLVGLVL